MRALRGKGLSKETPAWMYNTARHNEGVLVRMNKFYPKAALIFCQAPF